MWRTFGMMLAVLVLIASEARVGRCDVDPLGAPDAIGDQVVFFYDTRADFTTFLSLRNTSSDDLTVSILFYGPTVSTPFSKAVTLAGRALTILDVGALRDAGLPAQPGVAIATAVNLAGQPIATRALTGNFTVANLRTGSAFGAAGAARSAFRGGGNPTDIGDVIDGSDNARLQFIRPSSAVLAAYYDPTSLAPVTSSGNQLIFVNFEDEYEPTLKATIGSTAWNVSATRGNGVGISSTTFTANGVTVSDLASVAGPGVNGAAGSITFEAESDTKELNRLVYFTEALGTFGTGYLLPQVTPR